MPGHVSTGLAGSSVSVKQCCRNSQLPIIQGLVVQLLSYLKPSHFFHFFLLLGLPQEGDIIGDFTSTKTLVGQILETIEDGGERERENC